jgi:hypothetical protein
MHKVRNLIYEIYWFFKSLFERKNNGTKFDADDDDGNEDETVVSTLFIDNNEESESESAYYRV